MISSKRFEPRGLLGGSDRLSGHLRTADCLFPKSDSTASANLGALAGGAQTDLPIYRIKTMRDRVNVGACVPRTGMFCEPTVRFRRRFATHARCRASLAACVIRAIV